MSVFRFFSKQWRWPKVFVALMIIELAGTVPALVLFAVADPDAFRTELWRIGYDNGFNSSPDQILYAYANYQPLPKTPMVWSQFITSFNVVISVLSMFILLVKLIMFVMHVWFPILGILVNALLVALWAVSIYGQAGPDYSDPQYPSSVAWYIAKSCSYAEASGNVHNCELAKGTFAVTCIMMFIFLLNLVLGIWSLIPTKEQREAQKTEVDELNDSPSSAHSGEKLWEMRSVPGTASTMKQPFTPRTLAFHTLDRQLPLRDKSTR